MSLGNHDEPLNWPGILFAANGRVNLPARARTWVEKLRTRDLLDELWFRNQVVDIRFSELGGQGVS